MTFNPNEHLMKLSGKDYLEVKWRLVWFRDLFPGGSIETEMLHLDLDRETEEEVMMWNDEKKRKEKVIKRAQGFAVFRAIAKDGQGGIGTGTKSEKAASFPDFIEKAESGAIGRALAALGFGTQFTGDELNEEHRIVDSPVERMPLQPLQSKSDSASTSPSHPSSQNGKAMSATQPQEQAAKKQTRQDVIDAFLLGKEQGIWKDRDGFYTIASVVAGEAINEKNVNELSDEMLVEMLKQPA